MLLSAGAFWNSRQESSSHIATQLDQLFLSWSTLSPKHFRAWFTKGTSPQGGEQVWPGDALLALIQDGENRADTTGEGIEELGLSVALWNGSDIAFRSVMGATTINPAANKIVLRLPATEDDPELFDLSLITELVRVTADIVDPDIMTITNPDWAPDSSRSDPVLGWITYLKGYSLDAESVSVQPCAQGILVQTAPTPQQVDPALLQQLNTRLIKR